MSVLSKKGSIDGQPRFRTGIPEHGCSEAEVLLTPDAADVTHAEHPWHINIEGRDGRCQSRS